MRARRINVVMRWTPIRGPGGQKQRLALATALLALNVPAGAVSCRMLTSATPLPAPFSTRMQGRWAFVPTMARVGACSSFHSSRVLSLPAAPRKRIPDRTVEVRCSGCKALIYKYAKANGKGSGLVKCYHERILEDHTSPVGSLCCPSCQTEFARPAMIHGRPANKIIGGKVFMK